ncbi:hypothetical protein LOAG_14326 [Loa loa]|uniref:Fibronectin type-III domain-containing protein n=1 Tax=Loa loa TaxID=7209 RepID=A0A1I7W591_LOALO|nr:hypothetical protein LOAG_14326 [Loa loa]EFO14198.2 hypothetical protein LOAG_14326 [Loa loa]
MEPHPLIPTATTLTVLSASTIDISFEPTTVYYSIAPISYTVVSSSIPYRDITVSEDNVSSEQVSPFSTDTYSSTSNPSSSAKELSDDDPWNICNESTTEMLQLKHSFNMSSYSDTNFVTAQQLLLTPNLQVTTAAQRLSLCSIQHWNVMPQQLLPPSNPQAKIAAQRLLLPSNLLHAKTTTQSPSLPST